MCHEQMLKETSSIYSLASHYFQLEGPPEQDVVSACLATLNGFISQDLYSLLLRHVQTVNIPNLLCHSAQAEFLSQEASSHPV